MGEDSDSADSFLSALSMIRVLASTGTGVLTTPPDQRLIAKRPQTMRLQALPGALLQVRASNRLASYVMQLPRSGAGCRSGSPCPVEGRARGIDMALITSPLLGQAWLAGNPSLDLVVGVPNAC